MGVEVFPVLILEVEAGEEGQLGTPLQHMHPDLNIPHLLRALRQQQPLLCGAVLQGGRQGWGAREQEGGMKRCMPPTRHHQPCSHNVP
jgi:hypothetical protein